MSKLSKRERYLIIFALIFSLVALVAYVYYFPLRNEILQLEIESEELSIQIEEAKNTSAMIDTTRQELEKTQTEISEKRVFFMESIDEASLLSYINDMVVSKASLSSITYNESVDNDIYFTKDISINFISSYNGLKSILQALEEGDEYTLIPNLSISPVGDSTEIVESTNEDGETTTTEVTVSNSDINVTMTARFFGQEASWDGSGEYNFMNGSFGKNDIFQ